MIEREQYYYKMMLIGLKIIIITYQHLVNRVFKNQKGRNMKVYIDDMVIKSIKDDHTTDLQKAFNEFK